MRLNLTSDDRISKAVRPVVEQLEVRQLLSATLGTDGGLVVDGTSASDRVRIQMVNDKTQIYVQVNKEITYFDAKDVSSLQVNGGDGNDTILIYEVKGAITIPVTVHGGNGNDVILGGSGDDLLFGDAGNDSIKGGVGTDTIFGGDGNDSLYGDQGDDVINGEAGDDLIVTDAAGGDQVDGGDGVNEVHSAVTNNFPIITFTGIPDGYTPNQMRAGYGLGDLYNSQYINRGQNQAIAIVVAYHAPTASRDLAVFSREFHLPMPSVRNFKVVYPTGRRPHFDEGWSGEALLDIQWAHVIAPMAKLYLVEAGSDSPGDMYQAVKYASRLLNYRHGGGVVSMSWGGVEQGYEDLFEGVFGNPQAKRISYVAATGDNGAVVTYPASSPNVLAVGGSTLFLDDYGNRIPGFVTGTDAQTTIPTQFEDDCQATSPGGENPWAGGGGGVSTVFNLPPYQENLLGIPTDQLGRVTPDVAWNADPATGVTIYDTSNYGGWATVGGTSAGTPQFAALVALVNQERARNKTAKIGNQLISRIYRLGNTSNGLYFNDIDQYGTAAGNVQATKCAGGTDPAFFGYDAATGFGSPKTQGLIPALVQTKTRPLFGITQQVLTFTGRATANIQDQTQTSGGGTVGGGSTGAGGTNTSGQGIVGIQSLTFKGKARVYGYTTLRMDPIHMNQVFSTFTPPNSTTVGGTGSAGAVALTQQGVVDFFGMDPETGAANAITYDPVTGALLQQGTPITLYRQGNTITGTAYYTINFLVNGAASQNTGGDQNQGGGGQTTGASDPGIFGGTIKFIGTVDKHGKIQGKWVNIHPYLSFDPRTGQEIGGQPYTNVFDARIGGPIIRGGFD